MTIARKPLTRLFAVVLALAGPAAAAPPTSDACETMFAWITAERVGFHADSAELKQSSLNVLYRLAEFARDCPASRVAVTGHTDGVGDAGYNRVLSEQRARAVADFLESLGFPGDRLVVRGAGADEPLDDNATAWGRKRNRRIEFSLLDAEVAGGGSSENAQ
jgi:OOP family OmpA-OmpF porin